MIDDEEKRWTDADMQTSYRAARYNYKDEYSESFNEWLQQYKESKQKYSIEQVKVKIEGAVVRLINLQVPKETISRVTALTFLALCGIKPDMKWSDATRTSMRMTKDIIQFAIDNYSLKEHSNNRDQFRREAINILLNYELIDMNPDNKSLGPNSPLTHYSIKQKVLNKIKQ